MREYYNLELKSLNDQLTEYGALIETAIDYAAKALLNKDAQMAEKVSEYEKASDRKERDIESLCIKLILHQQPVAGDLRLISAALKMITDMERIADQADDIAELSRYLSDSSIETCTEHIRKMALATSKMVTAGIDAFVKRDLELAIAVCKSDDVADNLFKIIKKDITEIVRTNAQQGEYALDLLMAAKYFERISDHAVNIAEWVIYSITGNHDKPENADNVSIIDDLI